MNNYKVIGLAIFIFFTSFYSLFSIGHFGGDGYEDYLVAQSIVLDGNLSLDDSPSYLDHLHYAKNIGYRSQDGKIYSARRGIGLPLILSLFYFIGHIVSGVLKGIPHDFVTMFFVSFSNPVILALGCLLVFIISRYLYFSSSIAVMLSFIYGLATMVPVYSRTGFSEPALLLSMLTCLYLILKYKYNLRPGYLFASALAMAYMVIITPSALIFIPCFILYLIRIMLEKKNRLAAGLKDISIFLLFLALPLALFAFYNRYIHGGFLKLGGEEASDAGKRILASSHFLKGLYYYLFSTGKSLFLFNLPIILSIFALSRIPKERRKEAALFILIFSVNLVFYAKSFRRGSLFSWGPRYLMPSVAVLVFLIGDFYQNYKSRISRLILFFLASAGFFVMLPCLFINQSKFYFFVKDKLRLDEYLINFIPDLSPILGAWKMFVSRIALKFFNQNTPFIYNPDYRFLEPITANMEKYNYFDSWFLKILRYAPDYRNLAFIVMGFLIFLMGLSIFIIFKNRRFLTDEGKYTGIKL